MFGLFFDRSSSKQSPQSKPQDLHSRYSKSPPGNTYTDKPSYSQRVNSHSPPHSNNVPNSNTNVSPGKYQYSPKTSTTPTTFYIPKSIPNKDYKGPVCIRKPSIKEEEILISTIILHFIINIRTQNRNQQRKHTNEHANLLFQVCSNNLWAQQ